MMLPSHLLATVLAGLVVGSVRPLSAREWALLLGFGVAIDLDHLLQVPRYVQERGLAALLDPAATSAWGARWQGVLHGPWGAVAALAACAAFRSEVPLLGWGLHMVLDFVVARHFVRFGSAHEWAVVAGLAVAVALVAWNASRLAGAPSAAAHLQARLAAVLAALR